MYVSCNQRSVIKLFKPSKVRVSRVRAQLRRILHTEKWCTQYTMLNTPNVKDSLPRLIVVKIRQKLVAFFAMPDAQ